MPTSEYLVLEDFGRFYAYLKIFVVKFCQSLKKDWRLFEDSWINFFASLVQLKRALTSRGNPGVYHTVAV